MGAGRASGYGLNLKEYLATANRKLVVVCQVETAEAVANIEDMVQEEGVDAFLIGPWDLSGSLGHLGASSYTAAFLSIVLFLRVAGEPQVHHKS